MKTIMITMEQEKYEALTFYLEKKGKDAQKELEDNLKKLYEEAVPVEAREYIEFQAKSRQQAKEQALKEKEEKSRKKALERNAEEEKKEKQTEKKQSGLEKGNADGTVKSNI